MRPEDVSASLRDGGVALTVGTSGESVLLKSYLTEVAFADGTRWTWNDVRDRVGPAVFLGTDEDDVLKGSILDDTLTGGRGNDRLEGGRGDDVYVWNLGDGDDVVSDGMGTNVLQLGAGIVPGDVGTSVEGSALVFSLPDGARIVVEGGLEDERNCFAEVRFEDGTVWTMDDVRNRTEPVVVEGTDGDDTPLAGTHMRDVIRGRKGDDLLRGGKGDDVYEWNPGDGSDTLKLCA